MKIITADTKFSEIYALDGFKPVMAAMQPEIDGFLTPKTFAEGASPAWSGDAIAYGLNHLIKLQQGGTPIVQPLYGEADIAKEPDKAGVNLLWFPAEKKGPFALVCAGGGYHVVATVIEGAPVAAKLNELGISAFCLQYRVGKAPAVDRAREDMHAALRFIIENAVRFNVEPAYCAIGFSAGGHLVSTLGMDNIGWKSAGLPKPQMLALAYALVNIKATVPKEMLPFMLGEDYNDDTIKEYSAIYHLDNYPPAYIWHTVEDETVGYSENAEMIAEMLAKKGRLCILNRVERGAHGLGLGIASEAEGWLDEAVDFWKSQIGF